MSDLELSKIRAIDELRRLCAHCWAGRNHACPVQSITQEIKRISGVPLIVNNEFRGLLWR